MRRHLLISFVSGIAWGLIGYGIVRDTVFRSVAWVGFAAAPLIGIGIGALADRFRPDTWIARVLFSLLSLYVAVTLFAMVIACAWVLGPSKSANDGLREWGMGSVLAITFQGVLGFTMSGYWLVLWPLAVLNHFWLWSRRDEAPISLA